MTITVTIGVTALELRGGRRTQVNAVLGRRTLAAGGSSACTCRGWGLCLINRSCV